MAQLAIKGHTTRGKEVIEILEMLGYINLHNYVANCDSFCFYGGKSTNGIYYDWVNDCFADENVTVFTLEEFLEKYPYKIGDKVTVTGLPEYPKIINFMEWFDGDIHYSFDNETWFLPSALNLYKEETMDKVNKVIFDTNAQCCDISNRLIKEENMEERKYADLRLDVDQDDKLATEVTIDGGKITPPENYLIGKVTTVDNGLLVEFVKKRPQYPKTHVECCEILYPNENFQTVAQPIKGHHGKKLFALQKLLVCRDAYWKIAGEQMGLGKPWKPDWEDQEKATIKYCICISGNVISKDKFYLTNFILSFPTEEMRDAFYENFNVLIEICKELL